MSKIRKSAKGRDCEIRMPGVCNFNPETVVLCHLPGGGMGRKNPDIFGAFGCSACHDEADRRTTLYGALTATKYLHEGIFRTQQILLNEGFIKL